MEKVHVLSGKEDSPRNFDVGDYFITNDINHALPNISLYASSTPPTHVCVVANVDITTTIPIITIGNDSTTIIELIAMVLINLQ